MKRFLCALLCAIPLVTAAQPHKGAKLAQALTGQVEKQLARQALVHYQAPKTRQPVFQLLTQPTPTAKRPLLRDNIVLTTPQREAWQNNYQRILTDFEQFKQKASPFLFYQSLPLEKRQLTSEEGRVWLSDVVPLHDRILSFYLTTRQDPALQYALDYTEYGISVVDPYLVPVLHMRARPCVKPFNLQEFLLEPPAEGTLPDPSLTLDGKLIAIVNDDKSLLEHFEQLASWGVLFPGAHLHTNGAATQFLLWFNHTSPKPDIVFTDIHLGEANGYYVAHELRDLGYTGGIIALTSYAQTEENARQLKAAGFDGMVSLDERYWKVPFFQRATQAAQIYLLRTTK